MVHVFLHIFSFFNARLPNLLTVFIRPGAKKNILAYQTLVTRESVRLHELQRKTNVRIGIYIRNRCGDIKTIFFSLFISTEIHYLF